MLAQYESWIPNAETALQAAGAAVDVVREVGRISLKVETGQRLAHAVGHANGFVDLQVIDVETEQYLLNVSVSDGAEFDKAAAAFLERLIAHTPSASAASARSSTTASIVILDDWPFCNDPSEIGRGMPLVASAIRGSA